MVTHVAIRFYSAFLISVSLLSFGVCYEYSNPNLTGPNFRANKYLLYKSQTTVRFKYSSERKFSFSIHSPTATKVYCLITDDISMFLICCWILKVQYVCRHLTCSKREFKSEPSALSLVFCQKFCFCPNDRQWNFREIHFFCFRFCSQSHDYRGCPGLV